MSIGSKIIFASLFASFAWPSLVSGQVDDAFNKARKTTTSRTSAFNQNRVGNFNDYRTKLNVEYVRITREPWKDFRSNPQLEDPDRNVKPVVPIKMSDEDASRPKNDRQIDFGGTVKPVKGNPAPPSPIAPVKDVPEDGQQYFSFTYYGTPCNVRKPNNGTFRLKGTDNNSVADGWERLSKNQYNNMLVDCLKLRSEKKLCDWAYLMMLRQLSDAYLGAGTNEATLLMAFLFSQSGYKMRLGENGGKLYMLYASKHDVYGHIYFQCDGEKFFMMDNYSGSLKINAAKFPKEQSVSLWVNNLPQVQYNGSPLRTLTSKRYPDMSVKVSINKNLLDFYTSYPSSEVGGNLMTRWAMYANTSICQEGRTALYPQLKNCINGKTQLEQVERLLNWVQTAFVYEYDDKVWGCDRAFFPDESLYYPYCDCEDRSILFTRLVRDLLGLKCVLIYYPGHLASAVCFTDESQVAGDYLLIGGKRFFIADATYIGASVGMTMPNMDNATSKVIILE